MNYNDFLDRKTHLGGRYGFTPLWMPDFLFDFQRHLVEWSLEKGRSAIFADCGLGKTPMQLVWAENVLRHTNKPVLIATPLAVSYQTLREAEKFGIEAQRSLDGTVQKKAITITNYERLHYFNPDDFSALVCDESSILKNFDGRTKAVITDFMRKLPFRLLSTATAAPNDYIELGTSSEALGELGYMDMLMKFFKNNQNTIKPMVYRHRGTNFKELDANAKWRFKKHAEVPFWRWVCSWSRALRKPSDLGFDDSRFSLPELIEHQHVVTARRPAVGKLFDLPAVGIREEREERHRTLQERCEMVAELVSKSPKSLIWCHLNDEGDLLEKLIPEAKQVKGSDSDEKKEQTFIEFAQGDLKYLITKPKIGALGLNLQRCAHIVFFPSHSYEQYYQGVRRCWRYGQTQPVVVDTVYTEGELLVIENIQRKATAATRMFEALVSHMNEAMHIERAKPTNENINLPTWMSSQTATPSIMETVAS